MSKTIFTCMFIIVGLSTGCSNSGDPDGDVPNSNVPGNDVPNVDVSNQPDSVTLAPDNGNLRIARVDTMYDNGDTLSISTTYDDTGLILKQNYVENGVSAYTANFTHNASRQFVTQEDIDDIDGSILRVMRYSYSPSGQLAVRLQDNGDDGNNDWERVYSFNDDDIATGYSDSQLNIDGNVESTDIVTVEYDQDRVAAFNIDFDPPESIDSRQEFQYTMDRTVSMVTTTSFNGGRSGVATWIYEEGICNKNWINSTFAHFCLR